MKIMYKKENEVYKPSKRIECLINKMPALKKKKLR